MQIVSRHIFVTVDLLDPVYKDPEKFLNGQKHAQIHLSTTVYYFLLVLYLLSVLDWS